MILVSALVLPTSASEVAGNDSSWFNVLDYAYCEPLSFVGSGTMSFVSDDYFLFRFIDATVFVAGNSLTGAYMGGFKLNLINVGDGIYRVFGPVSRNWNQLDLRFTNDGSSESIVSVQRLYASGLDTSHFDWHGDLYYNGEFVGIYSDNGYPAFSAPSGIGSFEIGVHVEDWQKFDYLDVLLEFRNVQSVDSFISRFGDVYLPMSEVQWSGNDLNTVQVLVRIDLTGLDRTSTESVILSVIAYAWGDIEPHVALLSVSGYVVADLGNPVINNLKLFRTQVGVWFSDLSSTISTGLSSVSSNIVSGLSSLKASMETWFNTVHSKLVSFQTSMETSFSSLRTAMVNWFTTVSNQIHSLHSTLSDFWSDVCSWFLTVSDQLATLIGNGSEGDSLSDASGQLNNAADDVFDYEQSQQEILTNSFPAIQETVSFTGFVTALMFVQKYTNLTYAGLGDVSIMYMLPLVLGLFFYLCSRIPGATRWPARTQRKKDGDST